MHQNRNAPDPKRGDAGDKEGRNPEDGEGGAKAAMFIERDPVIPHVFNPRVGQGF